MTDSCTMWRMNKKNGNRKKKQYLPAMRLEYTFSYQENITKWGKFGSAVVKAAVKTASGYGVLVIWNKMDAAKGQRLSTIFRYNFFASVGQLWEMSSGTGNTISSLVEAIGSGCGCRLGRRSDWN